MTIRYPAGFVHLPKVDAEFMQQPAPSSLITRRDRNGFAIREWQKMRERNEALDCYVYARAAAAASASIALRIGTGEPQKKQLGITPALIPDLSMYPMPRPPTGWPRCSASAMADVV